MAVINTATHPKLLWPGIQAIWGDYFYNKWPNTHEKVFEIVNSNKKFEEDFQVSGFGLAPTKTEGAAISYDTEMGGFVTRYTNVAYAIGYVVTHEELVDNQYMEVSSRRAKGLAFSMHSTIQTVAANVLNRAENSSYTGGDGVELLSTAHVNTAGGTWANKATNDADLSEAALEDMFILIRTTKNDRGLNIPIMPECLIIPPNEMFNAERIVMSNLRVGTADNDLNATREMSMLPKGIVTWEYITDTDAWFVKTNCMNGMKFQWRERPSFTKDDDFDTMNVKAKGYMRFVPHWTDPRGMFGSLGA